MASHTRGGGPKQLKLQRFVEALDDPTSGLTYPALKGNLWWMLRDFSILTWQDLWRRRGTILTPSL